MPSSTVQARISNFETLSANRPSSSSPPSSSKTPADILETPLSPTTASRLQPVAPFTNTHPSPSPSPPNLGRKTSLIDLKDWVVDDGPSPPKSLSNGRIDNTKTPTQPAFSPKRTNQSPSPSTNLSVASKQPPQLPPRKPSYTSLKSPSSSSSKPSPPQSRATFLYPPRRSDSLTVEPAHSYPPSDPHLRNSSSSHAPSSSISSFHSVSLSSDTDPSTPGSVANFIATFPIDQEQHDSPPPPNGKHSDADSISLSESYEEVSKSSLASPATEHLIRMEWEKAMAKRKPVPPKLPERPNSARPPSSIIKSPPPPPSYPVSRATSVSGSTPSSPTIRPAFSGMSTPPVSYTPRRAAPPPPPSRSSDRSSIQSTTTTHSFASSSYSFSSQSQQSHSRMVNPPSIIGLAAKAKRPTPVPLAARKRYEPLFVQNVLQRRRAENRKSEDKLALLSPSEARGRRAAGWRGLSVDLITGGDGAAAETQVQLEDKIDEVVAADEKLEGGIVRLIWNRSGLDAERLAEIWNECDTTGQGALNLDAFVKGMWRIDEELRRAHAQALKSASTSLGAYRSSSLRSVKIPPKPRDILR
ncbi:unnamed protein product [Cyclocybe aegerita]|uniref:EH domain-containing protein n=1 Tax=Cyclocybe aegerita TaxID=1973307 RepID=A0A8S0W1E2_CYCAE|nr:unnamed protein product [Cyclocybe aegerita]